MLLAGFASRSLTSQFRKAEASEGEGIAGRPERENGELGQEKTNVREQSATQDEFAEPKSLVTLEEICFLHEQTARFSSATTHKTASSPEEPGRFREHELQASAEGITPVSWRFVPAEMEKWLTQANELAAAETLAVSEKQEVVQKSAVAQVIQELSEERAVQKLPEPRAIQELAETLARIHSRFVKTQPFATANGLVSRLATLTFCSFAGACRLPLFKSDSAVLISKLCSGPTSATSLSLATCSRKAYFAVWLGLPNLNPRKVLCRFQPWRPKKSMSQLCV